MFEKNNKVLFIIHDFYQSDNRFPLGIAYLAAVLNKKGAGVEAYCMDVFHYTNQQLAEHLQNNHYDLIGMGFGAGRFTETVLEVCHVINKNKKDAWLVLGGHGPSPIPEYVLKTTGADFVAIGEAENTILDLLKCKISNGDRSRVDGVAYLEQEQLKITSPNRPIKNLNELPFPLWEIFPMEIYTECSKMFHQLLGEKSISMIAGRGCTNRCSFCYRMEDGIRLRSIANFVEELKILYHKYGVNNYFFEDELFVLSKVRLLELEKALADNNLKIKFFCNARVDIMDEEIVQILKRCGCQFIGFGFESSDNRVLKLMNKNATVEQNVRALETLNKVGDIGMGLNFIWNNFGDSEASLRGNVRLIKKYNTYDQIRTIRPATPYPGSDLYDQLIRLGKLKGPEDFFKRFKNSDLMLINLLDISDEKAYQLLLEANKELILDHYQHVGGNLVEAYETIQQFADLYAGKITKFRGARHYNK